MSSKRFLFACLLVLTVACTAVRPAIPAHSPGSWQPESTNARAARPGELLPVSDQPGTRLFFPLVSNPDRISQDAAIWAHSTTRAAHEVVLFRRRFTLEEALTDATLHLFADTRYEAWLDGAWIGRGPARFSRSLHEYDIYPLGDLPPGEYLLAVLVQWAPNTRRSESVIPHLSGHIQGGRAGKVSIHAGTAAGWNCQQSNAWQQDAAPVHNWGLIGPTELLDLRSLPASWHQTGFDDTSWTSCVAVDASGSRYRPRTIQHPQETPVIPMLLDAGLVSPGYLWGEIMPPTSDPFTQVFSNTIPATFSMQALGIPGETAADIRLDGSPLTWKGADPGRPDVYSAEAYLLPGEHRLSFEGIPARGMTYAVSAQGFQYPQLPFNQGLHAGRRTLLADLESDMNQVIASTAPELNLEFAHLPGYAVLDLGRTVIGRLQAVVEGPPGAMIDIGWDERLTGSSQRPLPYPGSLHPEWNLVDSWVLDGSQRSISTIDSRAGRYILIAVWGDGPVTVKQIKVLEEAYPAAVVGSFTSSNPRLDQIWQVGLDTLRPNMLDGYTDNPWRERGQWWGDAYIADQVNRVSFGDTQMLKRGLGFMAEAFSSSDSPGLALNNSATHMLDYSMLWVASLSEYIRLTADRPFLRQLYPALREFMTYLAAYENVDSGLLELPAAHWSQTAYIESLGYHSRYGVSTAVNAMYYNTLQQAAYLAVQADDTHGAAGWAAKAAAVHQKANDLLYLPAEGRYATHIYQDNIYPPTPHAQAWALAYGLVPPQHVQKVADALLELLSADPSAPNLDIYGMYWVLEALGKNDKIPEALGIVENYFGYMLNRGATAWWERFDADQHYTSSLSHVWGGSPTWFLSTYILGAKWEGPGTWSVRPAFNGVARAAGRIPIDDGFLQVSWVRETCSQGSIEISSPIETRGEIMIAVREPILEATQDGAVVWGKGTPFQGNVSLSPEGLDIPLIGGDHSLSVSFDC